MNVILSAAKNLNLSAEAFSGGGISDEELLARFEDGSLPNGEFHHEQHVRVAWMFVRRYGMPDALPILPWDDDLMMRLSFSVTR